MDSDNPKLITRREFIKKSAVAAGSVAFLPWLGSLPKPDNLMRRRFGRTEREVTTMGLGGQASLQWTPSDVDPVAIILKAFDKGITYFDTSNLYGPSQMNYGKAFRKLNLIPGEPGYDERKRRNIFLTTKTHVRIAKGNLGKEGVENWTNGPRGSYAVDDLKRSLSQMFGDGKGNYPKGAYLDMILMHSVVSMTDVNTVYEGLYDTDPKAETIGALAAMRDYRDGTNLTGLNPKEEKLVNHVGFSGHNNPAVLMEMIQRDKDNLLDCMLVAMNANDKLNFNMQHNVLPVAQAEDMGVIAMKVFADGAMYSKDPHWSRVPDDVVRTVGSNALPFAPLIRYTLTTPGIDTAIIGIGQIDSDPDRCQLSQNIKAAQIRRDGLTASERAEIEQMAHKVKNGKTNYFQQEDGGLTAPTNPRLKPNGANRVELNWDTAFAGVNPIDHYEVIRDGKSIARVAHKPQTSKQPFSYEDQIESGSNPTYRIITIDKEGQKAQTDVLRG